MAAVANSFVSDFRLAWIGREFRPFPGREITTLRIVVTVVLVTIISMTLQVPNLFLSAFFVFFVTKENRSLTIITGMVMVVGATIAIGFSLFLYRYTFDYPELRVPVLAGLIFTGMFLSRVFFIGPLGFVFGFFGALTQTLTEGAPDTESLVRGTLWLWVSLIYPIVLTVVLNQILLPAHPWDALLRGLGNRLQAAAAALQRTLREGQAGGQTNPELLDQATRGSSALRTLLNFAESANPELKTRHASLTAVIAASEHLASATAALEFRPQIALTEDDQRCAECVLAEIQQLQSALGHHDPVLPPCQFAGKAPLSHLRELQSATKDFHNSLAGEKPGELVSSPKPPKQPLFVADAFTNPAHVQFALKVTLAAMICYLIYTGLDWPGISTSFVTCCFIALGNTGATMRRAWLRLIGCCGGGVLGFLCIIFLVPQMESIVSLVLLVAVVSALAGWVATGSDRISYGGLQGAFAFYYCLFQGYAPETNFTTIRDRVVGIALGIVVSSTIFRHVWPQHASDALRLTLARVLRNLAKLLILPQTGGSAEMAGPALDKISGEIAKDLDNSLHFSEVMIFEQGGRATGDGFPPPRLECMVANTQTLSLMIAVLLDKTKLEEWEQLEKPVQAAELVLRTNVADQLEQIAASLENRPAPKAGDLQASLVAWNQLAPPATQNDRPRLMRRVIEQIGEMS
jgi:multidrug resistance protein MdtO